MRRGVQPRLTKWRREYDAEITRKEAKILFRTNGHEWVCRLPVVKGRRSYGYGNSMLSSYTDALFQRHKLDIWIDKEFGINKVLDDIIDMNKPPTLFQSVKRRICRLFRAKNI